MQCFGVFQPHDSFLSYTGKQINDTSPLLRLSAGALLRELIQGLRNMEKFDRAPIHTPTKTSAPPKIRAEFTVSSASQFATSTVTKGNNTN